MPSGPGQAGRTSVSMRKVGSAFGPAPSTGRRSRTPTSLTTSSRTPSPSSWTRTPSMTPIPFSTWSTCSCPSTWRPPPFQWRLRSALAPAGREPAPPLQLAVRHRGTDRLSDPSGRPQPGRVPRADSDPDPFRQPSPRAVDGLGLRTEPGAQELPPRTPRRVDPDRAADPLGLRERPRRRGRGVGRARKAEDGSACPTARLTVQAPLADGPRSPLGALSSKDSTSRITPQFGPHTLALAVRPTFDRSVLPGTHQSSGAGSKARVGRPEGPAINIVLSDGFPGRQGPAPTRRR